MSVMPQAQECKVMLSALLKACAHWNDLYGPLSGSIPDIQELKLMAEHGAVYTNPTFHIPDEQTVQWMLQTKRKHKQEYADARERGEKTADKLCEAIENLWVEVKTIAEKLGMESTDTLETESWKELKRAFEPEDAKCTEKKPHRQ
ncbi:MAG: hypothetical protein Q9162_001158 [Coniocarpon cinnabarinum]